MYFAQKVFVVFIDEARDLDSDLQVHRGSKNSSYKESKKHVGINGVINILRINMKYKV